MTMTGLEEGATATLMISLVPFLAAWEAKGEGGHKYRQVVKKAMYMLNAAVSVPAGKICGILASIAAVFDPRTLESGKGLNSYRYRRNYRGRHYSGARSVNSIISQIRAEELALAT